jgi:hypothetical protein
MKHLAGGAIASVGKGLGWGPPVFGQKGFCGIGQQPGVARTLTWWTQRGANTIQTHRRD